MQTCSRDDAIEILRGIIADHGGNQAAVARAYGVEPAVITWALRGETRGDKIFKQLGLSRRNVFEVLADAQ